MQTRIPNIVFSDGVSDETLQDIEGFYQEWSNRQDTITVYTSGSTGSPKKMKLAKEKVRHSARATGLFFSFQKGQKLLLNLSVKHIAGKLMLVRAWLFEMDIIVLPVARNPLLEEEVTELFNRHKPIHFGAFVPYQVSAILENDRTRALYASIQQVIIGGAALHSTLEEQLKELPNRNFATFGMTETITHFALRNLEQEQPVYSCLPGFTIKTDERNCLVLEANPLTDELITNDRVLPIDSTRFEWLGREDFVINSGGVKISPEQLERKVGYLFSDQAYFFFGKADQELGERVVLFVEGKEQHTKGQLKGELSKILNKYEVPKDVYFIPAFERTGSGKVIRKDYTL